MDTTSIKPSEKGLKRSEDSKCCWEHLNTACAHWEMPFHRKRNPSSSGQNAHPLAFTNQEGINPDYNRQFEELQNLGE
ncbi:hypothetical protein Y1Q_0007378 [Alligator mississippiensis]|uniref:Uncharacterized protein n=1 Tax=Alligator mississippiensis TaxID=8496 RepID=A0A151P7L0_ALLMI|nr:hypothetical protein Y1Q_0007378 [Alligator mississippiensis]